jgi:hypothetical protein
MSAHQAEKEGRNVRLDVLPLRPQPHLNQVCSMSSLQEESLPEL